MYCKDCIFWEREKGNLIDRRFGDCEKVFDDISKDWNRNNLDSDADNVVIFDNDMYAADCRTGENFGCVHFQRRLNDE